ncbi:MAG TPA: helix-turn-helix domain-containing protein [Acetobacteraceae bacterium]|nr:helix-turn-helix domain-containing protein [Acetobacteraceae bacterium]
MTELALPIDTLMVAGGGKPRTGITQEMIDWLRTAATQARRFGSICTGAFLLGAGGLPDGRRVTTHWASRADLARFHPTASVEVDPIFIREGRFFSSAGITAGINLALSLVEEDHGRDFALNIARYLVLYLKRAGGQAQFPVRLQAQFSDVPAIERVQHWCEENLDRDLPAGVLCQIAGMSERSFIPKFRQETGQTLGEYVAMVRLEAACRRLTETGLLLKEVARKCGFGSVAAGVCVARRGAAAPSGGSAPAPRSRRLRSAPRSLPVHGGHLADRRAAGGTGTVVRAVSGAAWSGCSVRWDTSPRHTRLRGGWISSIAAGSKRAVHPLNPRSCDTVTASTISRAAGSFIGQSGPLESGKKLAAFKHLR